MKSYFVIKLSLLACLLTILTVQSQAQQEMKYVKQIDYLLYLPEQFAADTITKWPLMIFLHGAGDVGNDIKKVNVPSQIVEHGRKYPFILIAPQSPQNGWNEDNLAELIADVKDKFRVDHDRVYLTGLSMGGFGTWNTAIKYPELFAAIVPICGGGETANIWALQNMPVWCFHGDADNVVGIINSQQTVDALKEYNPNVKFTIYPGVDHDSWTPTYNNDEVFEWMLSKRRFKYEQIIIDDKLLEQYAGAYLSPTNDTITISADGGELQFARWSFKINLKAFSNDSFFLEPTVFDYLKFESDGSKITNCTLFMKMGKIVFRRL